MPAILFVEDDATIAMGVEYSLKQDGFQVSLAYRLAEARDLLKRSSFDLVLLDLSLPDGNGYELCKEIRAAGDTPIIILSGRDEEASIVLGLDLGADDYLTKPFRLRELLSRMKAVLRRRGYAHYYPLGPRRGGQHRPRPRPGRGRLSHQALPPARADLAHEGRAAPTWAGRGI